MNAIENEQLCSQCVQAFTHGSNRLGSVPGLIKGIIETEAWRERKVQTGRIVKLNSFRDLIMLPPLEGWGEDPEKIAAVLKDDQEVLTLFREKIVAPVGRPKKEEIREKSDNVTIKERGNTRAYTLSRLKSQHPKLFEQVKAGKLSANGAAIEAGFRKVPTVLDQLIRDWAKATAREKQEFLKWIDEFKERGK